MKPNFENAGPLMEAWIWNIFVPLLRDKKDVELDAGYNTIRLRKTIEGRECEASLSVEFRRDWNADGLVITDSDGNKWVKMKVAIDIGWSQQIQVDGKEFQVSTSDGKVHFTRIK